MGRSPPSQEYGGFAVYVGAIVALIVYLLWASLPKQFLEEVILVEYYPSRWWAVAVPAFVLVLMVYIYVALAAYNTEQLTFAPDRLETVTDYDAKVGSLKQLHEPSNAVLDLPLAAVSEILYANVD